MKATATEQKSIATSTHERSKQRKKTTVYTLSHKFTTETITKNLFTYRLKPYFKKIKESFSHKKESRLQYKFKKLKDLDFPISDENVLRELFQFISKRKKENIYHEQKTYTLSLNGENCEIDLIPFNDIRKDGTQKTRHEAIFSFQYPDGRTLTSETSENSDNPDPRKYIQIGGSKQLSLAWLMGKHAQKLARAVDSFLAPSRWSLDEKKIYFEREKYQANQEALYLKMFNNKKGFPQSYGSYHLENRNILLMKFYPIDLFDHLVKNQLTDYEKISLAIDMFSSLSTLHKMGKCHRDIKPENFLIEEINNKKHAILIDFGFCCDIKDTAQANRDLGTSEFLPWDRLLPYLYGEPCNVKNLISADIWACGASLSNLLWNTDISKPLKSTQTPKEIKTLLRHIKKRLTPLGTIKSETGDPLMNLVLKTLHFDPTKRPSAEEVVQELKVILESYKEEEPTYDLEKNSRRWKNYISDDVKTDSTNNEALYPSEETTFSNSQEGWDEQSTSTETTSTKDTH